MRLVDEAGNQVGILPTRDALRMAFDKSLDLVEVAATAKPPVCRIMDYGKYRYEESKRDREAKKKQKFIDIKELKMRPRIEEHDFQVRLRSCQRFLRDGDKVKAVITFRGREIVHSELGRGVLLRLAEEVADLGYIERDPRVEGRTMIMILGARENTAAVVKDAPAKESPAKEGPQQPAQSPSPSPSPAKPVASVNKQ